MTTVAPEAVTEVSEELEPHEPERSEAAPVPASEHFLRIEPSKGWVSLKLRSQQIVLG